MNRYIDAEAFWKKIKKYSLNEGTTLGKHSGVADEIIDILMNEPTADVVEVRHGRWINNHCTVCGMTPIGEEAWTRLGLTPPRFELCMSFCPCCGAKMDGERSENG